MTPLSASARKGLIGGALVVASVSQLMKRARPGSNVFWLLDLAAIALLALALRGTEKAPRPAPPQTPRSSPSAATRRAGFVLAGIGLLLSAICSLLLVKDWNSNLFRVLACGPFALLLFAFGLDTAQGYGERWRLGVSGWRLSRGELLALLAILVVAFLFRFWSFGSFPPPDGFSSIEETQRGSTARQILEKSSRPWEWPMPHYVTALSFRLFGYSMSALRAPSAVLGALTILPFFFWARRLTGTFPALFAASLLAVSRWHVQVSWYTEDVYVPLSIFVSILMLLALVRDEPRPLWFVLLGAALGYTLYDYAAFRVTPLLAAVFLAAAGISNRKRFSEFGRGVALAFGVLFLFALPLVKILREFGPKAYFESLSRSFANKSYYTADPEAFLAQRWERITNSADMFTVSARGFFETLNVGDAPLLDPYTGVLFMLGLGTVLLFFRERDHALIAGAFLVLTVGATVLVQNLDFRRLAILVPFVFVFPAFLVRKILAARLVGRREAVAVFCLVAALAGFSNARFLFGELASSKKVRASHRNEYTVPAFYLQRHYRGEYVVILAPDDGYVIGNFFEPTDYDWIKPAGLRGEVKTRVEDVLDPSTPLPGGSGILMLLQRPFDLEREISRIRQVYPAAECRIARNPDEPAHDLGACRIPPPARR